MTNYKILLVEDDMIDRISLQRYLKSYEDQYDYYYASSFKEANDIISSTVLDLIVTDYHLGDGNALELISLCKETPVIIITGANDVELAVTCMKSGAFDFLIKDSERSYLKMIPIACESAIKRKEQEKLLLKMIQAVEQSPSLILITDKDGIIEYANPKLTETTGYSLDELKGSKPSIFHSGHQDSDFYRNLWDKLSKGEKWNGEFYNKNKDGSFYWEFSSIAPLMNHSGDITHYVKVGENVTEKKKAEAEKLYTEKLKSVLELAGTVSHEINQPLQVILGHSELLIEKGNHEPGLKKSIQTIISNINRIVDITAKIRSITEYKTKRYLDTTDIIDID